MKTLTNLALITILILSSNVFATETQHKHQHTNNAPAQQAQTYICPMHPEVTGQKGDTCPKCGMNLEAQAGEHHKDDEAMHKEHAHQ
ncbi:heavy metal-binding domain-containing protein [Shewanella acanthi]|uniref:heavy metal-binding domain-containing protein n=1 Tax=Shewanella acanthi TaxID=2864212 RepID=UPI001C65C3E9|nr:heavy metal-binding domain-containing protein [Shewanella acanthi]QYJ78689.1 hypothetical protein K0H61_16675 [Shewanella acanthi]